jgi:NADH:ubiquinone oxidoreductase subunit E
MSSAELVPLMTGNGNGISTLPQVRRVVICAGTGCMANGAMKVFDQFKSAMKDSGLQVIL